MALLHSPVQHLDECQTHQKENPDHEHTKAALKDGVLNVTEGKPHNPPDGEEYLINAADDLADHTRGISWLEVPLACRLSKSRRLVR